MASALAAEPARGTAFALRLVVDPATTDSEPMTIEYAGRPGESVNVEKTSVLDQRAIRSAAVIKNHRGDPSIEFTLTEPGRKAFAEFTERHVGRRLVVAINGRGRSAPVIQTPILGGRILLSGNFTLPEAKDLVAGINGSAK